MTFAQPKRTDRDEHTFRSVQLYKYERGPQDARGFSFQNSTPGVRWGAFLLHLVLQYTRHSIRWIPMCKASNSAYIFTSH
jgi:hypothetical protein